MKILECSTKGDKRFSPFCSYVEAFGSVKSIENHYQTAKRFENKPIPKNWQQAKIWQKQNVKRLGFELPNGLWLPPETTKVDDLAIQWYIALWFKYLKQNPELVEIASEYDEFTDMFKSKFPFCQADVIRQVVKHGVNSLKPMCDELLTLIRNN